MRFPLRGGVRYRSRRSFRRQKSHTCERARESVRSSVRVEPHSANMHIARIEETDPEPVSAFEHPRAFTSAAEITSTTPGSASAAARTIGPQQEPAAARKHDHSRPRSRGVRTLRCVNLGDRCADGRAEHWLAEERTRRERPIRGIPEPPDGIRTHGRNSDARPERSERAGEASQRGERRRLR